MKLEEGKLYTTREPKHGPVRVRRWAHQRYPWRGDNGLTYGEDGRLLSWRDGDCDLVAEVPAEASRNVRSTWCKACRCTGYVALNCADGTTHIHHLVAEVSAEAPTLEQRVVELEREVAELEREVAELRKVKIDHHGWEPCCVLLTPDERRAQEIEKQQEASAEVIRDHEECERFVAGVAKQAREDFWFRKHKEAGKREREVEKVRAEFEVLARICGVDLPQSGTSPAAYGHHNFAWVAWLAAKGLA